MSSDSPNKDVLNSKFSFGARPTHNRQQSAPYPAATLHTTNVSQVINQKSSEPPKTPAEYALHILLTSFVRIAERKMNTILNSFTENEPDITTLLESGADPAFDNVLMNLGHIARQNPKPVIDSIMFWRKSRTEMRNETPFALTGEGSQIVLNGNPPEPQLIRRTTEPQMPLFLRAASSSSISSVSRDAAILADRRSLVSIYILCRALIEVVKQLSIEALEDEVGDKLEETVFNQLKNADPELIAQSPIRLANWNLFAELLGWLSNIRFASVSDRFIAALEKGGHGPMPKDKEAKMEMVIRGMRFLKVRIYPVHCLEESAEFLVSLARFFIDSHGFRIKQAYADIFLQMMLPIVGAATAEVNFPLWIQAIGLLYPKAIKMAEKARYWEVAFPLAVALLCLSPRDQFADKWMRLIEANASKLRDKNCKVIFVTSVARIVWVYLYRGSETRGNDTGKLETVVRTLFPTYKKYAHSLDLPVDPLVQIVRFIGVKHSEFCYQQVMAILAGGEHYNSLQSVSSSDVVFLQRHIIAVQAFVAILDDIHNGSPTPPFPVTDMQDERTVRYPSVRLSPSPATFYNDFCNYTYRMASFCDHVLSGNVGTEDRSNQSLKAHIFSTQETGGHGNFRERQLYVDLLSCTFDSFASCLPASVPIGRIMDLLCRQTSSTDPNLRVRAIGALKMIALNGEAQAAVTGYARVVLSVIEGIADFGVTDNNKAIKHQVSSALDLYICLLEIWLEQLRPGTQDAEKPEAFTPSRSREHNRSEELESTAVWTILEEIEANGFFLLCNQSRIVRSYAIKLLRFVSDFDGIMSHKLPTDSRPPGRYTRTEGSKPETKYTRIIDVLAHQGINLIEVQPELASVAERSRLQKLKQEKSPDVLLRLAESDSGVDTAIWLKIFPLFVRACFDRCPFTVVLSRNLVCERLLKMQGAIQVIAECHKVNAPFEVATRATNRPLGNADITTDQWKLYLTMACSTLTSTDEQIPRQTNSQNVASSLYISSYEHITSAKSLFNMILPLLSVDHASIREAVVAALGYININLYKALLENLQPIMRVLADDARSRFMQKPVSSIRKNLRQDRLRTEVTHVLQLTSPFLADRNVIGDDWILMTLINFIKDVKLFLSDPDIQIDWEYQRLRRYFCGLLDRVWSGIAKTESPSRWLPFEGRVSCFRLVEEWCNYGPHERTARDREERMRLAILEQYKDIRDRGTLTASMEIEKRNVELAALSAMASLCEGPVMQTIDGGENKKATMSFDIDGLFAWIAAVFNSASERLHSIGKSALRNLLVNNLMVDVLFDEVIRQTYAKTSNTKAAESYFQVLSAVIAEEPHNPCQTSQLMVLYLFKAGDKDVEIRSKALSLLQLLEARYLGKEFIDQFSPSMLNRTPAVYKKAQYALSLELSKAHTEQNFMVYSDCTKVFGILDPRLQRDLVTVMLPWVQTLELQLDSNGKDLSSSANMVLINLFEITLKYSHSLLNEIEGLWTALVSGPYVGNVKATLDFTISQCVERRDPIFVSYARQIIVYLCRAPAGSKLMEALYGNLQPRSMIPQLTEQAPVPNSEQKYAYIATLENILPSHSKQVVFSLGQLSLVFMVDLLVDSSIDVVSHLPTLLQAIFLQLDHYISLVQEQARELLIYLVYSLGQKSVNIAHKAVTATLLQKLRRKDGNLLWSYEELNIRSPSNIRAPPAMQLLVSETIAILSEHSVDLKATWGKIALTWATSCPVRHLACRSFQVFRCLRSDVDQSMLADMLARLSNTISDNSHEIQVFAMEIMCTLRTMANNLACEEQMEYPQLFWASVACLNSIHEQEFSEAMSVLAAILRMVNLAEPKTMDFFYNQMPPKWEGHFDGIHAMLLKGMRSSSTMPQTLALLNSLNQYPNSKLLGGKDRLMFTILANLPQLLHSLGDNRNAFDLFTPSLLMSRLAADCGFENLSKSFAAFGKSRFRNKEEFLRHIALNIRDAFFPEFEASCLIFLLGLLSNRETYMKTNTMELLKVILPFVDTRKPEFAGMGADLISPLLRLLQTEFAQLALEVLDRASAIVGGPRDRQVLRMSLGSKAMRKEYEKTATLFGIPDENGWSTPLPTVTAATTRANVHAVFYTCAIVASVEDLPLLPDVQFHMEDYGYQGSDNRSESMLSDDRGDASLGDMVSALHSLDVFFTEDVDSNTFVSNRKTSTDSGENVSETGPVVYDTRVAAILSRSLNRTPSTASFKTSLADSFATQDYRTPIHLGSAMHSKSSKLLPLSSKSTGVSKIYSNKLRTDSESEEEAFDELETIGDDVSESSFKLESLLRTAGRGANGVRNRLKGHNIDRDKDRSNKFIKKGKPTMTMLSKSPKVPNAKSPKEDIHNNHFWGK